jgi:hypothetical protein
MVLARPSCSKLLFVTETYTECTTSISIHIRFQVYWSTTTIIWTMDYIWTYIWTNMAFNCSVTDLARYRIVGKDYGMVPVQGPQRMS